MSEEFTNFMMDWSIQHLMSSPRFPHGNAYAKKAVGIVKEMYTKCHDVKLGLLLIKNTPTVTNGNVIHFQAPANVFFGCQSQSKFAYIHPNSNNDTCTLDAKNSANN